MQIYGDFCIFLHFFLRTEEFYIPYLGIYNKKDVIFSYSVCKKIINRSFP